MSELEQALAHYLEGEFTTAELELLKQHFLNDADFQSQMVDLTITERLLKSLAQSESNASEIVESLRLDRQGPAIAPVIRDNLKRQQIAFRTRILRDLALLAASVMVIVFGWQQLQSSFSNSNNPNIKVIQSIGAKWEGNHPNQEELTVGIWHLQAGILKLASGDGSNFILEGPAKFEIGNDQSWKFYSGRVYGDIDDQHSKLKLSTPHASFGELGSKFAMEVLNNEATHLNLLEGQGQWQVGKQKGTLPSQQWVSFTKSASAQTVESTSYRYLSSLPEINVQDYTLHHWSFDQHDGDTFPDSVIPPTELFYPAQWSELQDPPTGPVRVNGQFGDAIQLNGENQYLKTEWDGISGSKARTVAFWVKVPLDFNTSQGYGIVTWGTFKPGSTFQVSINPDKRYAADWIGRLRIGILEGELVGSTDLRDQRWHHVAVVMYESEKVETNDTHIILYVDGEVEQTRGRSFPLKTVTGEDDSVKVQFGRHHNTHGFFRGWLDEIVIVDKALEDWEVRSLMRYNRIIKSDHNLTL